MPPPTEAELPDRVLLLIVTMPERRFKMPPPPAMAELPDKVLLLIVTVPR
jgi:hypothetical protein